MNKHHICLPFDIEAHYADCLNDLRQYRLFLSSLFDAYPELFHQAFWQGFEFHSQYLLKKQQLCLRRIKLKATGKVFTMRPSFVLPYGIARTEEIEKAIYLRWRGVPFETLAHVFGRNASFWHRARLQLGRCSLIGTAVKDPQKLPRHLVADEKVTWLDGQEVYVTTTAAGGYFPGVGLASETTAESLLSDYEEFKKEAQELKDDYTPETVCTHGFKAMRRPCSRCFRR